MTKPLYLDMSMLDISKILMYEFWYDLLAQSIETRQDHALQKQIAFLFTLKPKIFLKIFLMMLKNGLIHLTVIKTIKDLFQ